MKKKIERIILFGDSFVEGQGIYDGLPNIDNPCNEGGRHGDDLREWRMKNSWEPYLKKYYPDVEVINYGRQGCDNYEQYRIFNKRCITFKPTDLVLFGFTSKYRESLISTQLGYRQGLGREDYSILHERNPLNHTPIAYERLNIEKFFGMDGDTPYYYDDIEEEFTKSFLKNWLVHTFEERTYEKLAQTNYLFYSEYCRRKGINIHFFDLFEPYLTPSFVEGFEIDTDMYLTYGDKDLHTYINDYEDTYGPYNHITSYWECNQTNPRGEGMIFHPNQHGYELWIDYMYDRWLSKWYE